MYVCMYSYIFTRMYTHTFHLAQTRISTAKVCMACVTYIDTQTPHMPIFTCTVHAKCMYVFLLCMSLCDICMLNVHVYVRFVHVRVYIRTCTSVQTVKF